MCQHLKILSSVFIYAKLVCCCAYFCTADSQTVLHYADVCVSYLSGKYRQNHQLNTKSSAKSSLVSSTVQQNRTCFPFFCDGLPIFILLTYITSQPQFLLPPFLPASPIPPLSPRCTHLPFPFRKEPASQQYQPSLTKPVTIRLSSYFHICSGPLTLGTESDFLFVAQDFQCSCHLFEATQQCHFTSYCSGLLAF